MRSHCNTASLIVKHWSADKQTEKRCKQSMHWTQIKGDAITFKQHLLLLLQATANHSHFTSPFLFIQADCSFISKALGAPHNKDVKTLQPPKYLQEESVLSWIKNTPSSPISHAFLQVKKPFSIHQKISFTPKRTKLATSS